MEFSTFLQKHPSFQILENYWDYELLLANNVVCAEKFFLDILYTRYSNDGIDNLDNFQLKLQKPGSRCVSACFFFLQAKYNILSVPKHLDIETYRRMELHAALKHQARDNL
jgi:hypothetical protein